MATGGSRQGQGGSESDMDVKTERFDLPVSLVCPAGIKDSQRQRIVSFMNRELSALKSYADLVLDMPFLHICEKFSFDKQNVLLSISVNNCKDLDLFFNISKKNPGKDMNKLSTITTDFYQRLEMLAGLGFSARDKMTIKIVMQKEKYEKVQKHMKESTIRHEPSRTVTDSAGTNISTSLREDTKPYKDSGYMPTEDTNLLIEHEKEDEREQGCMVKKTFIIHIPAEVKSVKMVSSSVKWLNRSMKPYCDNMFALEVKLPANYDSALTYQYEIKYKKLLWFGFSYTDSYVSGHYAIGDTSVNRDLLYGKLCTVAHLKDIIIGSAGKFSHLELIHQANHVCKHMQEKDARDCIKAVTTVALVDSDSITRLAAILGWITCNLHISIYCITDDILINRIVNTLKRRKLCEFPDENKKYLPVFYHALCKRSTICGDSIFEFADMFWDFFGDSFILQLFQESVGKSIALIPLSGCDNNILFERCKYLIMQSTDTGDNVFKELLEMLLRHCPTKHIVQLVCRINEVMKDELDVNEDILAAITSCTQTNILAGISKIKRDKLLIELLKLATSEVKLELENENIITSFQKGVCELLSGNIKLSGSILRETTLDCLHYSRCFQDFDSQTMLLQSVLESSSPVVRNLLLTLLNEEKLTDSVAVIETTMYRDWMQRELKDNLRLAHEHEIEFNIKKFITVVKVPVIESRHDVVASLQEVLCEWMQKISLKDLIQSIPSIDTLCDNEPTIASLVKDQVRNLLGKGGRRPYHVLLDFCWHETLTVHTRTKAELVSSTIEIFFQNQLEKGFFQVFETMLNHVDFWQTFVNGTGYYIDVVHKNPTYTYLKGAIQMISNHLKSDELDICHLSLISAATYKAIGLLKTVGMQEEEIRDLLEKHKTGIEESNNRIQVTLSTVKSVQKRNIPNMPDLKYLIVSIEKMETRMKNGNICLKECTSVQWQWGDLEALPAICQSLHQLVKSDVFWNVSSEPIAEVYKDDMSCRSDLHSLLFVRYLYDDDQSEEDVEMLAKLQDSVDFLSAVNDTGIPLYSKFWENLEKNAEIKLIDVMDIFQGANVPDELEVVEGFLKRYIFRKTRTTLLQIWKTKDVIDTAKAIEAVIEVLGYNVEDYATLNQDILSFKELINQKVEHYTLHQIHGALANIFGLTDSLSEATIKIMQEMGKSKLLIEFLQEIAIGDIRNLIDAVEDISESHVQESTVSALIEIKRFLEPLINPPVGTVNSRWVFDTLEKQTKSRKDQAIGIPSKIADCSDNLHNLKSLYNNVANRGQQTKEIIKSIVTKGEFIFTLYPEREVVTYTVQYRENKNKYDKQETTLLDMRSRALLLLNSDRQSSESRFNTEEFRSFINSIDQCIEIRDTLLQLYTSGNIRYTNYSRKLSINSLQELKKSLNDDLNEWTRKLEEIRRQYYLMNFIRGSQIHAVIRFLQTRQSDVGVAALLTFIHPEMTTSSLLEVYEGELHSTEDEQVEEMGRSIHSAYKELGLFHRTMVCTNCTRKIGERVQVGSVFVCQLDESSNYVIKTILALYHNTTHNLPEPNQLLFCSPETRWDEIELLLQRCRDAMEFYGELPLYCMANVEKLQNEVQFRLVDELQRLKSGTKFLLAIVCRGSKNHPFVDRLSENVAHIQPLSDVSLEKIFEEMFPDVCTYTSEVAGLGKTSQIIRDASTKELGTSTLHISGTFERKALVECLMSLRIRKFHVLLLDIGSVDDLDELDVFLFELVVLKFVSAGTCAFYLSTANVAIEIANSINNILRDSLLVATSFHRDHLKWNDFDDFLPSLEINSPVQVVCKYLHALEHGNLDQTDLKFSEKEKTAVLSVGKCRKLLKKYMTTDSDISFSIVHIFLNVLAEQLKKLSCSSFFKVSRIADMIGKNVIPTVRSNLVKCMIEVSREFASRSVNACRSEQGTTLSYEKAVEMSSKDLAESAVSRVESMIQWEESNHLIYVFHNQNIQTLSAMYRDKTKIPEHVRKMFETQMNKPLPNFSQMKQLELQQILQRVARIQRTPLTDKQLADLSSDYALTPDNLLKMVLIMMRVQSRVPIVIMGETGCGKTSLIRYLAGICEVSFTVMNIHAGTSQQDVIETIMKSNDRCVATPNKPNWLFLDEINTSENIGLICDTICHHKCNGKDLMPNLVIMGACNPYKMRTEQAIKTAGLTGKVKTDDLSKLVYRVLPLPEMMVDYVWDFGSLNETDEALYIGRMLEGIIGKSPPLHTLMRDLLSASQKFVREHEGSTCVVSLRDVHRCKTLFCWFQQSLNRKKTKTKISVEMNIRAMILALAHCYHSRFMDKNVRSMYRQVLSKEMKKNATDIASDKILDIIKEEQNDILDRMDLPPGTAKNSALQENIFVILVCILNKIPIFVVGKPGCSKSLAMQVIRNNLRGKDSRDVFFKDLPQLYCVSFQGSESSTSDGIKKVFERAENYQKSNTKDDVLSVVILDEIGLAEVSRFNPLKVLHSLLEPEGRSRPNVAVVGISNWALDASKMNRAIHLSRPDMDVDELFETAVSISKSFTKAVETEQRGLNFTQTNTGAALPHVDIDEDLKLISKSYISYTKQLQHKHFHGLRDFYSLVKYVARRITQEKQKTLSSELKADIIVEGLQRNFGGLRLSQSNIVEHFQICFQSTKYSTTPVDRLIGMNISDTLARHLMVITKGESVLGIIEQHLHHLKREKTETIFGSQFEEDLTDDYNYRILSKIILCMEHGIVLILKDLENIYGSLYDMLNQNYTQMGKKNHCRVALGPYSNPFCHVAETFRCIVLVDENKLDYSDPPFLNRFEKQYLTFSDVLTYQQQNMVSEMRSWVNRLTYIEDMPFSELSAFPYFNEELLVSLVLYMEKFEDEDSTHLLECCKQELLWLLRPEAILRLEKVSDSEIQDSRLDIQEEYFDLPIHEGLGHLIDYHISHREKLSPNKTTVIFTNSNIHSKVSDELMPWSYQSEKIGAFKSEKQLSVTLKQFWETPDTEILLVHCNAEEDGKHLMLTKSVIEKCITQYNKTSTENKLVYIIVHLNGRDLYQTVSSNQSESSLGSVTQINYLSGCKLVMLDSLEKPIRPLPLLYKCSLFEMAQSLVETSNGLKNEIFWAFTRIKFGEQSRDVDGINDILIKIKESEHFLGYLADLVCSNLKDKLPPTDDEGWCVAVASDIQALNTCSNFVNALEEHVKNFVKIPLAKFIYEMERMGILDCFFIDDDQMGGRRSLWWTLVQDEGFFSIDNIPDPSGPECFFCDTPDVALKMPFSSVVFQAIEKTKDTFMDGVMRAKVKCELEADDELPSEIMRELELLHEGFISSAVPACMVEHSLDSYPALSEDYTDDFCNLYSNNVVSHLNCVDRVKYTKWLLFQKSTIKDDQLLIIISNIHCHGWIHCSTITPALQLLELCSDTFDQDLFHSKSVSQFSSKDECSIISSIKDEQTAENDPDTVDESGIKLEMYSDESEIDPGDQDVSEMETTIKLEKEVNINRDPELEINPEKDTNISGDSLLEKDISDTSDFHNYLNKNTSTNSGLESDINLDKVTNMSDEFIVDSCPQSDSNIDVESESQSEVFERNDDMDKLSDPEDGEREEEDDVDSDLPERENLIVTEKGDNEPISTNLSFSYAGSLTDKGEEMKGELAKPKGSRAFQNIGELISNVGALEEFVSIVSRQMLIKFANGASKKWLHATRNFITLATEVSDVHDLHKLRLCSDVNTYFLEPNDLPIDNLEPLGVVLQGYSIDSDEVFNELINLFETVSDDECIAEIKTKTLCQYLYRCISSDEETTAYSFLFQAITDSIIPRDEYGLLKEPLSTFITDETVVEILMESTYDAESVDLEDDSLLSKLNICLQTLQSDGRQEDGPFVVMVVDLLQYMIEIPEEDTELAHLMTKAGSVLQKEDFSLLHVTAIALMKAAIETLVGRVLDDEDDIGSLLQTLNASIAGLEHTPLYQTIRVYYLKTLGRYLPLHLISKYCTELSCMSDMNWLKQFWPKNLEYNPLAIYLPASVLQKAEPLMLQTDSFDKSMDDLKKLAGQKDCNGKLLVFSLAVSEYYTRRYRQMLEDTVKAQANDFLIVAESLMQSPYDKNVIQFLTGKYNIEVLELNEHTSFQQFMINTSLISFYCLLLSKWNDKSLLGKSLLLKSFFTPSGIEVLYVPGMATSHSKQWLANSVIHHQKFTFGLCSCSYRIVLHDADSLQCVICKKDIQVDENVDPDHVVPANTTYRGIACSDAPTESSRFYGNMTALSFNLFHYFLKGALLGSLVLGSNWEVVEKILEKSEIDLIEYLHGQINNHWKQIGSLLNLDDYQIRQFLHTILMSSEKILFKSCSVFNSLDDFTEWEHVFDSHISHLASSSIGSLHKHHQSCNDVYKLPGGSVETQIREADREDNLPDTVMLPNIFRLTKSSSKDNFMCRLSTCGNKYPFLVKVLQMKENLQLPIHLYNIIQWHMTTCIKISYSMKRWQCADMTVREFIEKQNNKIRLRKTFKTFKESVNSLKKYLDEEELSDLPSLNEDSKLVDCLMLDTDCWLYKVQSKLVHIQNEFIDFCLKLSFSCKNLQFLVRSDNSACFRYVRVTELKTENLINIEMDDEKFEELLHENSCSELTYGQGHVMRYDFHNIEKDLAYDLLIDGRRAYIKQTGLQFIVFKDELYRMFVSLLKDVNQSVPQKPLSSDLVSQIRKSTVDAPNMANEMINNLDMIFTLLKRTKCDPETPLVEYIQKFSHMIGKDFPKKYLPSPEGRLKVCHVVSFHETLEEISADQVLGSLEEMYETELGEELLQHFRNMASESLFKAEVVVGALKRFIYRCIYMCKATPEQQLSQYIKEASFWKDSSMIEGKLKLDGNLHEVSEVIPSEVKVCHVAHIVQLMNETIDTQRQGDLRIDHVITSWKTKQQTPAKPKQATKVKSKLKKR